MDPANATKGKSLAQNLNSQGPDGFSCSEVTQGSLVDPKLGRWQNKVSQSASQPSQKSRDNCSLIQCLFFHGKTIKSTATVPAFAQRMGV